MGFGASDVREKSLGFQRLILIKGLVWRTWSFADMDLARGKGGDDAALVDNATEFGKLRFVD